MWCINRFGNILRFPWAAGELPRAGALRDLTYAFLPQESTYISYAKAVLHSSLELVFRLCPSLFSSLLTCNVPFGKE